MDGEQSIKRDKARILGFFFVIMLIFVMIIVMKLFQPFLKCSFI